MKKICLLFILSQFLSVNIFAQIFFQENDTLYHEINHKTSEEVLAKYLESVKAKDMVFSEEIPQYYKVQNKRGKWQLMYMDYSDPVFINKKPYDEVFLPSKAFAEAELSIVKNKGKYAFLDLKQWGESKKPDFAYDSILFLNGEEINKIKAHNKPHIENGDYGLTKVVPNLEFAVMKEGTWGKLVSTLNAGLLVAEPFIYPNINKIPNTIWDTYNQLPYLQHLYENKNVDLVQPFPQELVYVLGRDKTNKKWGLYGGEGDKFEELIEPAYDTIIGHKYPLVYEVWKENKVGYYNGDFKLVAEPKYEKFQYVHLDNTYGCALYTNNFWQLYDAYNNKLLVNGKAETVENLIELWLNR